MSQCGGGWRGRASSTHLGDVETSGVDHSVADGAQRLKLAGRLQQVLEQRGIVLGAIHSDTHGLLAGPVHPVKALTPALHLVLVHHWP